jgi:hypothetical protein
MSPKYVLYLSEKKLNLFVFVDRFPDEASCQAHFKNERDRLGIVCKKCGCSEHYWKKDRESYQHRISR